MKKEMNHLRLLMTIFTAGFAGWMGSAIFSQLDYQPVATILGGLIVGFIVAPVYYLLVGRP